MTEAGNTLRTGCKLPMKYHSLLHLIAIAAALLAVPAEELLAQEVRSLDGTGNNQVYEDWGAAHTSVYRLLSPAYDDGIAAPGGVDRPNPRMISNEIFSQSGRINDQLTLSDYVWVFGQFIDHDIVLSEGMPSEPMFIEVPAGDPDMDPAGTGQAIIPMFRNLYDLSTGTDTDNPRHHINSITAFIDGSAVYGTDSDRANWLRSFEGGRLKVSAGNLLPFNTLTGEYNDPRDPDAPFMADDTHSGGKLFVAGDVRANENPLLITFHTMFVREHNRLCEIYQERHPEWDDERLYQKARRVVSGLIQSVVYNEWLPAMGVELPTYSGYNPGVDPGISNVFAAAGFRLGHTLLSSEIMRLDNEGQVIPQGNIGLRAAFFNPKEILFAGGLDPYIKGMGSQIQQDLDCKVIDDVRNFLFGAPGQGGLDLAAINIMRGRERGVADFNDVRRQLGLDPYSSFNQVCVDGALTSDLLAVYGDIDNVDCWVGLLAEDHMPSALFGETIMILMEDQFVRLRDGDRFFYQNDPGLTIDEVDEISTTKLSDIIRRNTGVSLMQENVFFAKEHDEIPFARAQITNTDLDVTVFPNPVRYQAHVKSYSKDAGEGVARIFDATGRVVMEQDITFIRGINTMSIDVENVLVQGTYVLQLERDGSYNSIRFVKH